MNTLPPPFFIVGFPRSGTTLLRFMLCSHPDIFIPEETGFLPFLNFPTSRPLTESEIYRLINRIRELNYLWHNIPASAELLTQISPATLANVLDRLYCLHIAPRQPHRWGDKTPLYVEFIPKILNIFPNAQFIHVIRDGRDAALSARAKWGAHAPYMDLVYLLSNWQHAVTIGRREGERLGIGQYLEIQYEELVNQPEAVLRRVCAFLGEDFHPFMLDHTVLARQIGPGPDNHEEVLLPVHSSSIGRWQIGMSPFERKLADRIAGPLLSDLGYPRPNPEPFNLPEKIHWRVLHLHYRVFDSLRSVLYRTGILTLNRTKRRRIVDS
jgi:hypothetical protein